MSGLKLLPSPLRSWVGSALLLLTACADPPAWISSKPLNRVVRPLVLPGQVDKERVTESTVSLNATYYFLLGQRLSAAGRVDEALTAFERVRSLDPDSALIHYMLAEEYLKKGLSKEGVAMVKKAIELDPKYREARLLLASLHATAKKYPQAEALFVELMEENPEDEEIVLNLTLLELEQKKFDLARSRLQAFLKRNPESALAYFYLGRLEQERGRKDEALRAYQKAVELRPGFVQAGTYLGFLEEEMKLTDAAIETFSWLALQTDGARYHKKLGQLYLEKNQYEKSLESFLNHERVDPQDLNNKVKIGLLLLELKKPDAAEQRFLQILKESPDSENVRFYLASVYEELKKYSQANEHYKKIPESSKLYLEALKRRAWLLAKLGKWEEGRRLIEKAMEQSAEPERRDEWVEMLVGFLSNEKKFDEAKSYLQQQLKERPESERLLYAQGILLEKVQDLEGAVASMQKILHRTPDHAAALNFVGFLWADQGKRLPEAEKMIRRALRGRPGDPFITDSLGWVLFRQGRYLEAEKFLEVAMKAAPEESVIAAHLGDVLVQMGRLSEAKKYYERALTLGPEKDSEKHALEQKILRLHEDLEKSCQKNTSSLEAPICRSSPDGGAVQLHESPRSPSSASTP